MTHRDGSREEKEGQRALAVAAIGTNAYPATVQLLPQESPAGLEREEGGIEDKPPKTAATKLDDKARHSNPECDR